MISPTGDGTAATKVVPLTTIVGVGPEAAPWPVVGDCLLTDDGTAAKNVVPLTTIVGVGTEAAARPPAGVCSAIGPTAKVTKGPAVCSAGRDGMIVAPISPEIRLLAGVASMLTALLENVGLKTTPATVMAEMMEASVTPANPFVDVAKIAELSAFAALCSAVSVGTWDGPPPSGDAVATVDTIAVPPMSVEMGELKPAVSPEEPIIEVVEEPTTAT